MNVFKISFTGLLCVFSFKAIAQVSPDTFLQSPDAYFGQTLPGNSPEEFAEIFLETEGQRYQNSSFSPDGKEFLYNVFNEQTNSYALYQTNYVNGSWTVPARAAFTESLKEKLIYEPRHHPDGRGLYLIVEGELFYSEKKGNGWTVPEKLEDPVNLPNTEHPALDQNNTLYFWSRREGEDDLYQSVPEKGKYNSLSNLGVPVNSPAFDGDPFIALDGGYLIFTSNRGMATATTEGTWLGGGGTDLYISYRKSGKWTNPKNLGSEVNKEDVWNYNPLVTPDGKYFIFGRRKMGENGYSKLYWMSAAFIDSLRNTNFEPYVRKGIQNQVAKAGSPFSFQFPEDTFIDDDGNHTLTYSAFLSNEAPLPKWLKFNPASGKFSGTPAGPGEVSIIVRATDITKASITSPPFTIKVEER